MSSPSPELIALIQSRADWQQSDAAIAAALNAATVPNPTPQGVRLPVIYSANIMGMLSSESATKVNRSTALLQVKADIAAQNRAACVEWVFWFVQTGDITAGEAQAITAHLLTPVADTSYQSEVPEILSSAGRLVDSEDVAAARATLSGGDE